MKAILPVLILVVIALNSSAQMGEIKFKDASFANGLVYPVIVIPAHQTLADSINADIYSRVAFLKSSDFCIGQYGYVQKSSHLQIHLYHQCIDSEESENRYFLYNLEEGRSVPYSDLLNPTQRAAAGEFLLGKIKATLAQKGSSISEKMVNQILNDNLNAMQVEMTKDGLNLRLLNAEGWPEGTVCTVTWIEMKPFLKYQFI